MRSTDAFTILGLAPTLDAAAVKRAYFAALARHPPHRDAAAFRRVREAYEALAQEGALADALLTSPVDVAAELARFSREFDAALAAAPALCRREATEADAPRRFVTRFSRLSWKEALEATGGVSLPSPPGDPLPERQAASAPEAVANDAEA